jgi:hypothetical protein
MSLNVPHPSAAVEGYYTKFDFPNGAHIVLVICSVRQAYDPSRAHMVSFTYQPPTGNEFWQRQFYDRTISMRRTPKAEHNNAFELDVPGVGYVRFDGDGDVEYDLDFNDFRFCARVRSEVMWSGGQDEPGWESSPEGWLSILPLPLHWHVSSLRSRGTCDLQVMNNAVPQLISASHQTVCAHLEKNWGNSFPKSHIWIQARKQNRYLCLAGGAVVPGVKAFLVGYRSEDLELDFKPPFAMQLLGVSPFISSRADWGSRTFQLDVRSFTTRLVVEATSPPDSFFTLGAPFPEGHREHALGQSFRATAHLKIYHRPFPFMTWSELREEVFENASLEFGGAYFGGFVQTGSKLKTL